MHLGATANDGSWKLERPREMNGTERRQLPITLRGSLLRRRRNHGTSLAVLVPIAVAGQALVFGWLVPSQQAGIFPVLPIAGFRVRIDELLVMIGFVGWICVKGLRMLGVGAERGGGALARSSRSGRVLGIVAIAGLGQAAVRGFAGGNVENLQEARVLIIPLLFFAVARDEMRWLPQERLQKVLYRALLPASTLLLLSQVDGIRRIVERGVANFGGIYGGLSVSVEPLVIFFLCMCWAQWFFGKRRRTGSLILVGTMTVALLARVSKTAWFEVSVMLLTMVALSIKRRPDRHFSLWGRLTRLLGAYALLSVLLLLAVVTYRWGFPDRWEDQLAVAHQRVTRPDADGDVSGGRLEMMRAGWEKAPDALWFGRGLGMWYEFWLNGGYVNTWPDHFSPLWLLIRAGLLTTLAVGLLLGRYLRAGLRALRRTREPDHFAFVAACLTYTVVVIAYSLIGVPQTLFEPQIFFWLAVAVVISSADSGTIPARGQTAESPGAVCAT